LLSVKSLAIMQVLYGYSPLNGGRTHTLPGSESHRMEAIFACNRNFISYVLIL
jgi:hypothetical protein